MNKDSYNWERTRERNRRSSEARHRADRHMRQRYPEEWQGLVRRYKALIDNERGPLPDLQQ